MSLNMRMMPSLDKAPLGKTFLTPHVGTLDKPHYSAVLDLRMNEGAGVITHDFTRYGNNGTLLPAPGPPTWVTGRSGRGLRLNGIDQYIDVGDRPSLDVRDNFSFEFWCNLDAGADDRHEIISKESYRVWIEEDTRRLRFGYHHGGGVWGAENFIATLITWGVWNHYIITVEGTKILAYLNNSIPEEELLNGSPLDSGAGDEFHIGRDSRLADNFAEGIVDGVRVYSDYVLSAEDVTARFFGVAI